jgi:hypothetical protein
MDTKNELPQYFLYIIIGLLTSMFTSKTYDVVNKYENINKIKCIYKNNNGYSVDNSKYDLCTTNKNKLINEYTTNKMYYMLVIGFLLLVLGVTASNYQEKSNATLKGLSLGGLFLIIFYVISNWSKINNVHQIILIGAILASLMYLGLGNKIIKN